MKGLSRGLLWHSKQVRVVAFRRRIHSHVHACMHARSGQALTSNSAVTRTATAGSSNSCCCAHIWQAPKVIALAGAAVEVLPRQQCILHTHMWAHSCARGVLSAACTVIRFCSCAGFFSTIGRIAAPPAAESMEEREGGLAWCLCSVAVADWAMLSRARQKEWPGLLAHVVSVLRCGSRTGAYVSCCRNTPCCTQLQFAQPVVLCSCVGLRWG